MTTDPGHPKSDALAVERFRTILADTMLDSAVGSYASGNHPTIDYHAGRILDHFPSAQFVHDVNANGVPVRRLAVHGEWEVDPNPPTMPRVETGDLVSYTDREFGHHDDWEVRTVFHDATEPSYSLLLLARPGWKPGRYVNTSAREVKVTSRAPRNNEEP